MDNHALQVKTLKEITLQSFIDAISISLGAGVSSVAPLGFSGDTFILHEAERKEGRSRSEQVSIRMYSGSPELLITDKKGRFLFYGRYDGGMGIDFLAKQYYSIFRKVKKYIKSNAPELAKANLDGAQHCVPTEGFAMLKAYNDKKATCANSTTA